MEILSARVPRVTTINVLNREHISALFVEKQTCIFIGAGTAIRIRAQVWAIFWRVSRYAF